MGDDSGQGPMAMKRRPDGPKPVANFEELEKRMTQQGYTVNKVTDVDTGTAIMFANKIEQMFGQGTVQTGKQPKVVEAGADSTGGQGAGKQPEYYEANIVQSIPGGIFRAALDLGLVGFGYKKLYKKGTRPVSRTTMRMNNDNSGTPYLMPGASGQMEPVYVEKSEAMIRAAEWGQRGLRFGAGFLIAYGIQDLLKIPGLNPDQSMTTSTLLPAGCGLIFALDKNFKWTIATVTRTAKVAGKIPGVKPTGELFGEMWRVWKNPADFEMTVAAASKEWIQLRQNIARTYVAPVEGNLSGIINEEIMKAHSEKAGTAAGPIIETVNEQLRQGGMELAEGERLKVSIETALNKNTALTEKISDVGSLIRAKLPTEVPIEHLRLGEFKESMALPRYAGKPFWSQLAMHIHETGIAKVASVGDAEYLIPEGVKPIGVEKPPRLGSMVGAWKASPRSAKIGAGVVGGLAIAGASYYAYRKIKEKSGRSTETPEEKVVPGSGGAAATKKQEVTRRVLKESDFANLAGKEKAIYEQLKGMGVPPGGIILPSTPTNGTMYGSSTSSSTNEIKPLPIRLEDGKTAIWVRCTVTTGSATGSVQEAVPLTIESEKGAPNSPLHKWDKDNLPFSYAEIIDGKLRVRFDGFGLDMEPAEIFINPELGKPFDVVCVFDKSSSSWEMYVDGAQKGQPSVALVKVKDGKLFNAKTQGGFLYIESGARATTNKSRNDPRVTLRTEDPFEVPEKK